MSEQPAKIRVVGAYLVLPDDPGVYWHDGQSTIDLSWDTDLVERLRPQIERLRKQAKREPMTSKPES